MNISLELIKKLREKTGAGMSDCKIALEEAGGDMTKAVEILRKKGIAKAAKRSEREACEGLIKVGVNKEGNEGYIVEINAETDFVVRSQQFQDFTRQAMEIIKTKRPADREALLAENLGGRTIKESLENLSGVIGEKLEIKRYDILTFGGTVAAYSHPGERVGVLVALNKKGETELAREIAMQIAAVNPKYVSPAEVPAEELAKEKEIYAEQLAKEDKAEAMTEKIIQGKLNKYFEEVCLIKQEYIKDDSKKVEDILGGVKVEKFIRYSL